MLHQEYQALVIGPGREKGMVMVGMLEELKKITNLDKLEAMSGSSIGSMIVLLLALGHTPDEIFKIGLEKELLDGIPKSDSIIEQGFILLDKYMSDFGLIDIKQVTKDVEKYIKAKCKNKIPTMQELYEQTGIELHFSTMNVTETELEDLNHMTHPTLSCLKAIQMSCRIPFIFTKCDYRGCTYMDACHIDPFPIKCVDNGKRNILCLSVRGNMSKCGNPMVDHYIDIFNCMLYIPSKKAREEIVDARITIIEKEVEDDLFITDSQKMNFYLAGKNLIIENFSLTKIGEEVTTLKLL